MNTKRVTIPAISCAWCAKAIRRALEAIDGVKKVEVNLPLKEVSVHWLPPATWEEIVKTLREIEYPPQECDIL